MTFQIGRSLAELWHQRTRMTGHQRTRMTAHQRTHEYNSSNECYNGKYGEYSKRGRTEFRDKGRDRGWGRIGWKLNLSMKVAEGFSITEKITCDTEKLWPNRNLRGSFKSFSLYQNLFSALLHVWTQCLFYSYYFEYLFILIVILCIFRPHSVQVFFLPTKAVSYRVASRDTF